MMSNATVDESNTSSKVSSTPTKPPAKKRRNLLERSSQHKRILQRDTYRNWIRFWSHLGQLPLFLQRLMSVLLGIIPHQSHLVFPHLLLLHIMLLILTALILEITTTNQVPVLELTTNQVSVLILLWFVQVARIPLLPVTKGSGGRSVYTVFWIMLKGKTLNAQLKRELGEYIIRRFLL